MWVQLKAKKSIEERGELTNYQPGDYVNVGKQTALLWISQGEAVIPGTNYLQQMGLTVGAGVLILGEERDGAPNTARAMFADQKDPEVTVGDYSLPYDKTIIWRPTVALRKEMIPVGLSLLDRWQIAAPIWDYDNLACHVGDAREQELTQAITRDLRVPLYETGLMYVKRCRETEMLFDRFAEERARGQNIGLAFLRALYRTPLLVLPLPMSWHSVNR